MRVEQVANIELPWRSYWYLGSPFTKYPKGKDAAVRDIARVAHQLTEMRVPVFCPVAHSAPLVAHAPLPTDNDFWMIQCLPLVRSAYGLLVATMDGWQESRGLQDEIAEAKNLGKPIIYLTV